MLVGREAVRNGGFSFSLSDSEEAIGVAPSCSMLLITSTNDHFVAEDPPQLYRVTIV